MAIWRSYDILISTMEFPNAGKNFYIESGPWMPSAFYVVAAQYAISRYSWSFYNGRMLLYV